MTISSRTPEGDPNTCPVCGSYVCVDPSKPPGDAPCPSCGSLLWFSAAEADPKSDEVVRVAGLKPNGKLNPEGGGDSIPLLAPRLKIGRLKSCDICLRFSNVSSMHCELSFDGGWWTIRDTDSTIGVRVNEERVKYQVLRSGDRIVIGKRTYVIEYAPPVGK